jgi:hypothetical protein
MLVRGRVPALRFKLSCDVSSRLVLWSIDAWVENKQRVCSTEAWCVDFSQAQQRAVEVACIDAKCSAFDKSRMRVALGYGVAVRPPSIRMHAAADDAVARAYVVCCCSLVGVQCAAASSACSVPWPRQHPVCCSPILLCHYRSACNSSVCSAGWNTRRLTPSRDCVP